MIVVHKNRSTSDLSEFHPNTQKLSQVKKCSAGENILIKRFSFLMRAEITKVESLNAGKCLGNSR